MRKDESEITEEQKVEAKRRIQGQVAEDSPEDSGSGLEGSEGEGLTVQVPPLGSVGGPAVTA